MGSQLSAVEAGQSGVSGLESLMDSRFQLVVDQLYYGCPMEVEVRVTSEITFENNWYVVRQSMNRSRIDYAWVQKKRIGVERHRLVAEFSKPLQVEQIGELNVVSGTSAYSSGSLLLLLYTDGGMIRNGNFRSCIMSQVFNPLAQLNVQIESSDLRKTVICSFRMNRNIGPCTLAMTHQNFQISSISLRTSSSRAQVARLDCPRLSGYYRVSVRFGSSERTNLGVCQIHVQQEGRFELFVQAEGRGTSSHYSKALVLRPGQAISIHLRPWSRILCDNQKDALFFVPTDKNGSVSLADLQVSSKIYLQRQHFQNTVVVHAPSDNGLYAVVLGLVHNSGIYLPGDKCLIFTTSFSETYAVDNPSSTAGATKIPFEEPETNAEASDAAVESASSLCCVCQDQIVCIKLDPCKHVVLCEACFNSLHSRPNMHCPVCRELVTDSERVYL